MFQDLHLFEEVVSEQLVISSRDRLKLKEWADSWILAASLKNPGTWVEEFRPRLRELVQSIEFRVSEGRTYLDCPAKSKPTLTLLTRGSQWFDGVDQLELELLGVVMT